MHSLANKHFLKVADLAALESDYYKSINNYERIGRQSINNNLMKWSVKDYLLKAGICHLATKVCSSILENATSRGLLLTSSRIWSKPTAPSNHTESLTPPSPRRASTSSL